MCWFSFYQRPLIVPFSRPDSEVCADVVKMKRNRQIFLAMRRMLELNKKTGGLSGGVEFSSIAR
jgi:hypothetical protein